MRVLVSGGGTAGHVSPILATVDALKRLDKSAEFLYVGAGTGIEAKLVRAAGLRFKGIAAGKYRRFHQLQLRHKVANMSSTVRNIPDLFRVLRGVWQSRKIIKEYDPDIIFIKGGFVGLPVGIAARTLGYPFVVHESDMVAGLTNKILSRWAQKVAVGFPAEKYGDWRKDKLVYTGSPIRAIISRSHRLEGIKHFKLNPDKPVVLILGGSSGARRINDAIVDCLEELLKLSQLIHVAGEGEIERVKFDTRGLDPTLAKNYILAAYLSDDIGMALEAADVVISRAGANTLAELALLKKPTILIPNPYLVGGHQTLNAQVLARAGAVRIITEDRLNPPTLIREVGLVVESEKERDDLAKKIGEFAVPDADERLAKVIIESAREPEKEKEEPDA